MKQRDGLKAWAVVLLIGSWCGVAASAANQTPEPGDAVEVREGDVWSSAEFLGREGRRIQIRYDDGTEEWITADRLRMPGEAGAAESPSGAGDKVAQKPLRQFRSGQEVELKCHNQWKPVKIKQVAPPLYLIAPDGKMGENQLFWLWVDADRLRTPGENHNGPDVSGQFEKRVASDSIPESKRKAKQAYQQHLLKEAQTTRDASGRRDPFAAPPFAYEPIDADRSKMQSVSLTGGDWVAVEADGGARQARPFSMTVRAGENAVFESPQALSVAGDFGLVVIVDSPPNGVKSVFVERFDARSGRSLGDTKTEDGSLPLAIDPTGKRLAGRAQGFHGGSKSRVDVWDWSGPKPTHLVSFTPITSGSKAWRDVEALAFVDPQTLLVHGNDGSVSAWTVGAGQAVGLWEARSERGRFYAVRDWALSPGGRQVALLTGDRVLLLDTATGQTLTTLPDADSRLRAVAFSPNGRYVAAAGPGRVKRWNLTTAEAGPDIALPPGGVVEVMAFDDGSVSAKGRLIDADTGRLLWKHELPVAQQMAASPGQRLAVTRQSVPRKTVYSLNGWPLPDPEAARAAEALSPAETLLQDGDTVAIDLRQLETDAETRNAIEAALRQQLEARGVSIVDDAAVRIVGVTTTQSEQKVYEERAFGTPSWEREQTTVDVKTQTTRLAIEADGLPAWAWVTTRSPSSFVTRKEGQSVQEAVDASAVGGGAKRLSSLRLPEIIPDPRQAPAGSSRLIPGGFE